VRVRSAKFASMVHSIVLVPGRGKRQNIREIRANGYPLSNFPYLQFLNGKMIKDIL
jgi:hypothetical protein